MAEAAGLRSEQASELVKVELVTAKHRRLLATGLIFCVWTLIGLLYASQHYLGLGDGEILCSMVAASRLAVVERAMCGWR